MVINQPAGSSRTCSENGRRRCRGKQCQHHLGIREKGIGSPGGPYLNDLMMMNGYYRRENNYNNENKPAS
jgi:hypothetical protein